MSGVALAVLDVDPEGGFQIRDSRDGVSLAWRGERGHAYEVAWYLNHAYPAPTLAPAHDSLVHEIVCARVAGEPPLSLDAVLSVGQLSGSCPGCVPTGPGWDHLVSESI